MSDTLLRTVNLGMDKGKLLPIRMLSDFFSVRGLANRFSEAGMVTVLMGELQYELKEGAQ